MKYQLIFVRMAIIKTKDKCWIDCGETETLAFCWQNAKWKIEKSIQREILSEETSAFRDEERTREMLNIWVNIIVYSPLEFFKIW